MSKNKNEFDNEQPAIGEFPFPLPNGAQESSYLIWLRNHSNYMVTRGFLDYLRIAAVMMRGILLNILIIVPFLSILAVVIGHLYGPQLRSATIFSADISREDVDDLAKKLTAEKSQTVILLSNGQEYRPDLLDYWLGARLKKSTRELLFGLRDHLDKIGPVQPDFVANLRNDIHPVLIADLVEIISNGSIYDTIIFKNVKLSNLSKDLLRKYGDNTGSLNGAHVRRLNRHLLEDAYPEIKKHNTSYEGKIYEFITTETFLSQYDFKPWMPKPFTLTTWAIWIGILVVLVSPVLRVFGEIRGHRKSMVRAGSDSSVQSRDLYERVLGFVLLFILLVAAFETLPVLVDQFHHFLVRQDMNWNAIFTSVAGVSVAVMGAAGKILSAFSGLTKKLIMLLISALGVFVPLLFFLHVTNFLVFPPEYSSPDSPLNIGDMTVISIIPWVFVVLLLVGTVYGIFKRAFTFREVGKLLLLLGVLIWVIFRMYYFLNTTDALDLDDGQSWNNFLVFALAIELWIYCRIVVDINWTSIHGLYRDRLASAYLVGNDTKGDVAIEEDINLWEIGRHEQGSVAPYHLINTTLNLQGSKDVSLRDRSSDFFVFSKRFVGCNRTGYCRSATLEQVHPQMNLATAMAISAAAASPNMGRATSPAMVAMMVLLNIRLGYWLPNPGLLEEKLSSGGLFAGLGRMGRRIVSKFRRNAPEDVNKTPGFTFEEVFVHELGEVERRWANIYANTTPQDQRSLFHVDDQKFRSPSTEHGLVGIGFSGGGIRSATINLGIAQALHKHGIFDHIDYMSTVSGGGYLGASISTLMRQKSALADVPRAKAGFHTLPRKHKSEIKGTVDVSENQWSEKIVMVNGLENSDAQREYRFLRFDRLKVKTGDKVKKGQELVERHNALWDRFKWRVRPKALLNEMMMRLNETQKWVNLSDGGHIENLAGVELLRRRCRFIIIGDGEADPNLSFNGLATLIRYARIDLGIEIDIKTDAISPEKSKLAFDEGREGLSKEHWVLGTIRYPPLPSDESGPEIGYLLYLKSSVSGDEDEVVKEYRHRNPSFPHQSTADQFFNEEQFECYRALGEHIGHQPFKETVSGIPEGKMSYEDFCTWLVGRNPRQESE